MQKFVTLDFETRSEADLKRCGSWEYSMHPSTEILCVSWAFGTKEELKTAPIKSWSPFIPAPHGELIKALCDPSVIIVAHNALFEQSITRNTLSRIIHRPELKDIPPERWLCTASLAAALALPRSLGEACRVLGLPHQKDKDGHRLMLKISKPKPPWSKWAREGKNPKKWIQSVTVDGDSGLPNWIEIGGEPQKWHNKLSDLKRLTQYCEQDIRAEVALFLQARPLSETERKVWVLDQKINLRGFRVDRELVDRALEMIALETKNLNEETRSIGNGAFTTTNQVAAVTAWLKKQGVYLPDLRAKTVLDTLRSGAATGDSKRILEIRQSVSRTSTAKYLAFRARSGTDGRVRDNLVYHTASTGRWGGAGVQPQNFPRGHIKDLETAIEAIKSGDLEWVRTLYGNPMRVFSSVLRGGIIASEGKEFHCSDFVSIEARKLFWFAKHEVGLRAFREGRNLYKEMAGFIYKRDPASIEKDTLEYFVGKGVILGCGYQMGGKKFHATCLAQGIEIDEDQAEIAVRTYRTAHAPVTTLWYNIERASVAAVRNPGKKFSINYTSWFVANGFLWCQLPSGRRLAYYGPEIRFKKTPWGEDKAMLHHWGINPATRKWELGPTYGGRLTENVVQASSRDLMAHAMLKAEERGYEVVLSVHDELLAERKIGEGSAKEFEEIMTDIPAWAEGAPVKAEGWTGLRYKK